MPKITLDTKEVDTLASVLKYVLANDDSVPDDVAIRLLKVLRKVLRAE